VSHIRGPRMNYRLKYWLSTGRLSVRPFIASDEVSWGQLAHGGPPVCRPVQSAKVLHVSCAQHIDHLREAPSTKT